MNFIAEDLSAYIESHSSVPDPLLQELERETYLRCLMPQMCSGHQQGRLLGLISKIHRPSKILEIGTFTGYSALCLAEGLADNGLLHSVDNNPEIMDMAQSYVDRSPYKNSIQLHLGNGLDWIDKLDESWDLAFLDADKENYPAYYEALMPRLKPGSILLADNVLWSGKVTQSVRPSDRETIALQAYNRTIVQDPRLEVLILSVRDGISLARVR